jgi:hypothetical protein
MNPTDLLKWTFWTILGLLAVVIILMFLFEANPSTLGRPDRLEYYKFYLDAFKVILISGLVALVAALVPQILAQARADFDKRKESRIAYSNAKTGIDYLPLRLSALKLSEASALIQQTHVYKHQAELYEELLERWLRRRNDQRSSLQWGDDMYDKLFAIRQVLERHGAEWDSLSPSQRLELLYKVAPTVKES